MKIKSIKLHNKNFLALFSLLLLELFILLLALVTPSKAAAFGGTLLDARPGVSTDLNTSVDGKYAFSPLVSAQTKVTVKSYSGGTPTAPNPNKDPEFTQMFNVPSGGTFKASILYTNIGFSNDGKAMDALVDVTVSGVNNWVKITPVGHVQLDGAYSTTENMKASATVNFVEHGTNTPAKVSGHLTFGNINSLKVVSMDLKVFDKIYSQPTSTNLIRYIDNSDGTTNLSSNDNPKDKTGLRFTGTFSDKSTLQYSFHGAGYPQIDTGFEMGSIVDVDIPKANKSGIDDTTSTMSAQALKQPAAIQVTNTMSTRLDPRAWEVPNLTQNSNQNLLQPKMEVPKLTPRSTPVDVWGLRPLYAISQVVTEKKAGYLSDYHITDKIDPYWTLTPDNPKFTGDVSSSIRVTDENNKDCSSYFTSTIDGSNNLTISATSAALNSAAFYGHSYTFTINGTFVKTTDNKFPENLPAVPTSTDYASKTNIAHASYQVASSHKLTESDTATATNKIKYPDRPTLKVGDIYNDDDKIKGTVNDALSHGSDTTYLDLSITYTDKTGASKTAPLKINTPATTVGHENRIINNTPGTDVTFEADLPDDIKPIGNAANYNQPFTVTAEDNYGIKGQATASMKSWWDVSNGTLTMHPHNIDINAKQASDWPWDSQRASINKVVIESGVRATKSLDYMLQGMNLTELDLTNLDMTNVTSTTKMLDGLSNLTKLTLGTKNKFPSPAALPTKTATSGNWRGVGSGTETAPNGTIYDSNDLIAHYKDIDTPQETFVMDKTTWWNIDSNGTLDIFAHDIDMVVTSRASWPWYNNKSVKKVVIHPGVIDSAKKSSGDYTAEDMFQDLVNATEIDGMENLDTSKVTDMSAMFSGDLALKVINGFDGLDTSNVTDMSAMYRYCNNLTDLDLSHFDTHNVTNMTEMFRGSTSDISKLKTLDISNFDMTKVKYTVDMLAHNINLSEITLSSKTRFPNDPGLTAGKLKPGDNSTTQDSTKWQAVGLASGGTVYAPKGDVLTNKELIARYDNQTGPKETYVWQNMWWDYDKTDPADLTGTLTIHPHQINLNAKTATDWPWNNLRGQIAKVVFDNDSPGVSATGSLDDMFQGMNNLTSITGLNTFDTSQATSMASMFDGDSNLESVDLSGKFNMANVTNMSSMLQSDAKLTTLDLSNQDLSKVTNQKDAFTETSGLTQLKFGTQTQLTKDSGLPGGPGAHTKKWQAVGSGTVTNPAGDAYSVDELAARYPAGSSNPAETYVGDQRWWDITTDGTLNIYSHTIDYQYDGSNHAPAWPWFNQPGYTNDTVKKVVINGKIDTSGTSTLQNMFAHMQKLKTIEGLKNLDTTNVANMHAMFWDTGLTSLDLSGFKMDNVQDTDAMLASTPNLQQITLGPDNRFPNVPGLAENTTGTGKWREVGSGTVDAPAGEMISAADMIKKYQSGSDKARTYVWDTRWWTLDNSNKLTIYGTPDVKGAKAASDWPWDSNRADITSVDIKSGVKLNDSAQYMFSGMSKLDSLDLKNLDMTAKTSTDNMLKDTPLKQLTLGTKTVFNGDPMLKEIPINTGKWQAVDTAHGGSVAAPKGSILSAADLFYKYKSAGVPDETYVWDTTWWDIQNGILTIYPHNIDLDITYASDWPWSKQTNDITTINIKPSVQAKSLKYMFASLPNLTGITGLENITSTSPNADMSYLFEGDTSLQSLDLSKLDMTNSYYTNNMFAKDTKLSNLKLGPKNQFRENPSIPAAPANEDSTNHTNNWQAVGGGTVAQPKGEVLSTAAIWGKYQNLGGPEETYVWDTTWWTFANGTLTIYKHNIDSKEDLGVSDKNSVKSGSWPWNGQRTSITTVDIKPGVTTDSTAGMFQSMTKLSTINGLENLDTSQVTDMSDTFKWTYALKTLNLGKKADGTPVWNTANVTNMARMFMGGSSSHPLESLDISGLDMSKVTDTSGMFTNDSNLSQLTLGDKTKFLTDPKFDPKLTEAPGNTETNHTHNWQAVGTGDVNNPAGDVLSAQELVGKYQSTGGPDETYVWDTTWWLFDDKTGDLSIYKHKLDLKSNGTVAPAWPWDNLRSTANPKPATEVSKVEIKDEVTASGSLQSMFAHMKNLKEITGLNNLKTRDVTNMRAMFWDTGLSTIDISGLDMSHVTDSAAMLKQNSKLWKITLGPNQQFSNISDSPILAAPGNDTPFPENGNYVSRSSDWQELKSTDADDYHPTGDEISAADLVKNYSNISKDGKSHTYVWAPSEAGYLKFAAVPGKLDYGTVINHPNFLGWLNPQNKTQEFTVTDNRAFRASHNPWQVLAYGSALQSEQDGSTLANTEFRYKTTPLTASAPGELYNRNQATDIGTATEAKYTWNLVSPDQPGIQLFIPRNKVDPSGKYKATITYELRDSI